jgi:uncharacterized protein YbjT (DUF2867 family)
VRILVIGAAGALGSRIFDGLRERGVPVIGLTRRPGARYRIGDLSDPESLVRAMREADRVFLQSSPTVDQVRLETNAIEAAEATGVERVVKLSNIPIAGLESGLHGNHRAIERRLVSSELQHTFVQPSFFTSVVERQRAQIERGKFVLPTGAGKIAWIEPADIADVAIEALVRDDLDGALHITGPEALDGADVAARLGVQHVDPPLDAWRDAAVAGGLDPWLAESTVHLYEAIVRGALANVTDTVQRVTGRPATPAFSR